MPTLISPDKFSGPSRWDNQQGQLPFRKRKRRLFIKQDGDICPFGKARGKSDIKQDGDNCPFTKAKDKPIKQTATLASSEKQEPRKRHKAESDVKQKKTKDLKQKKTFALSKK